jgi:hypothetical protein
MNCYHQMINQLFALLALLNTSDSDDKGADWLRVEDSSQRVGAYGDVNNALVKLAGQAIVDHWAETNEVDLTLANRNS